jgi:creatinine amidohydrolase
LIRYFIQTRLEKRRDYAVFFFEPGSDSTYTRQLSALHKSDPAGDQHAGERETSSLLYLRPDLVEMDSASNESGANQHRLKIPNIYTAIWWYASYPNHYAGDGSKATRAEGQLVNEHYIGQLVEALRAVKADTKTLELQKEYFDRVKEK